MENLGNRCHKRNPHVNCNVEKNSFYPQEAILPVRMLSEKGPLLSQKPAFSVSESISHSPDQSFTAVLIH